MTTMTSKRLNEIIGVLGVPAAAPLIAARSAIKSADKARHERKSAAKGVNPKSLSSIADSVESRAMVIEHLAYIIERMSVRDRFKLAQALKRR